MTAVLYLPTVAGSFVTAIAAAALGYADWFATVLLAIRGKLFAKTVTFPLLAVADSRKPSSRSNL